jgi:branched-chain amino acid transport system substrate-binding protein
MFKKILLAAGIAALATSGAASAQTIRIADVAELSGAGAAAGSVWHDGVVMGYDEINAAGGILGRQVELQAYDSQTDPQNSRAMVQKAIDEGTYVLMGTVYSSSTIVNMLVAQQNGMPQFTGSESPTITAQGNPYIFRTSFGAQKGLPKIGSYLADDLNVSKIAVVWANTEFGKGGYNAFLNVAEANGMEIVADIPTEQAQVDFAADVSLVASSGAEAVFVYLTEEESARFLLEANKQSLGMPMAGDTVLVSQKVIDLAGEAANGAFGHVGLSANAPISAIQEVAARFEERFGYAPDHNALKGYIGAWTVKYVTEMIGELNREAFAEKMHGLCLDAATYPGVLMDVCWDDSGEISRASFLVEVVDGAQVITRTLPAN